MSPLHLGHHVLVGLIFPVERVLEGVGAAGLSLCSAVLVLQAPLPQGHFTSV